MRSRFLLLLSFCLSVAACSAPAPPVSIISVERLPQEKVLSTQPYLEKEVLYRFGVRAADLPRLKDENGALKFWIFRCPGVGADPDNKGRLWTMPTVAEPAAPGAGIVYVRMSTTSRYVDTDNWHCGSFHRERGLVLETSEDLSEVFRFQPQGDTDLTRDREPSSVRVPPPPAR